MRPPATGGGWVNQIIDLADTIAANADASGLADAQRGQLANRFIRQRAGARNDANAAFQVNTRRHNANFAFAG